MPTIVIPDDYPVVMAASSAYRQLKEKTSVAYYDTLPGTEDALIERIRDFEIVILGPAPDADVQRPPGHCGELGRIALQVPPALAHVIHVKPSRRRVPAQHREEIAPVGRRPQSNLDGRHELQAGGLLDRAAGQEPKGDDQRCLEHPFSLGRQAPAFHPRRREKRGRTVSNAPI